MGPNHKKLEYFNDKTRVFARNSNSDPYEIPDSSLPAHHILSTYLDIRDHLTQKRKRRV